MDLMAMNKIFKFCLSLSCFIPLYIILSIKNIRKIVDVYQNIVSNENDAGISLVQDLRYNLYLLFVWIVLIFLASIGLIWFKKTFLKNKKAAKRKINITSVKNITAEYYFTYFSLFVLTFFTIDLTSSEDYLNMIIILLLLILMIWVYLKNDMFFINPILNIIGYKSYLITYNRNTENQNINTSEDLLEEKKDKQFEVRVFSKENIESGTHDNWLISLSEYDFSICYKA